VTDALHSRYAQNGWMDGCAYVRVCVWPGEFVEGWLAGWVFIVSE